MTTRRLAIGTVQFGLPYGIANHAGQVSLSEATAILECARSSGIDTVDTAIVYGESEQRLGEIGLERLKVVSKLPPMPESCKDVSAWVWDSVLGSLVRLNAPKLHGLLLHSPQQLLGTQGETLYRALLALKVEGKVEKIGISIYSPEELDVLWPHFQFDLVQSPFNIIDRRLAVSGWLNRLHQYGVEIHVRSIFLQGLLLMGSASRPVYFNRWQSLWAQWDHWLDKQAMTPLQACLNFVLAQPAIDRVVVGVDSLMQLKEILINVARPNLEPPETLSSGDLSLINPSYWPK